MAENIVIYAGTGKTGKFKKSALEREALRTTKRGSVSELVWDLLTKFGSDQFKKDIQAAERGARR